MRIIGSDLADLTGSLLVALPTLLDPNFRRTILFLIKHDPSEGAMGVILNRPQSTHLADHNDSIPERLALVGVFEGGPVEKHQLILAKMIVEENCTLFEALGSEEESLPKDLSPHELRGFMGYAGWNAGQLEREIEEKSWLVLQPQPDLLAAAKSHHEGEILWRRIMKNLGPWYHLMSLAPDDPGLN